MATQTCEPTTALGMNHLLSLGELAPEQVRALLDRAAEIKADLPAWSNALAGKAIVLLFEKESLRTKVSFEIGIARLGGVAVYHDHQACRIGERESVPDYANNLARMADAIVARTYGHDVLEGLAAVSPVPIINALSETFHPCQAMADLFTLRERLGVLDGASIAYVGDGNNVCHSLMLAGALLGVSITAISPTGYAPDQAITDQARAFAATTGAEITITPDLDAVAGHTAIYTDAWVSMGHEQEAALRHVALAGYQVTADLMAKAGPDTLFMHCLPAHRGFEVAADVIDSPNSIVFDQAENRMFVQNAILVELLTNPSKEV